MAANDDLESHVAWSEFSETDRVLFTVLSNPERVDISGLPVQPLRYDDRIEELPRIVEEDPPPPPPRPSTPPPPRPSTPLVPPPDAFTPYPTGCDAARPASPPLPPPPDAAPVPSDATPPPPPPVHTQEEDGDTKRTLLLDLRRLEMQGLRLSKEWTMDDAADDMMLEIRKHSLAMDEMSNVNMMRDGMRLLVTGIEMVNNRIGLLDLEGWSSDVCRDLNKHDANLSRIYRKYWKRSTSTSPEVDICMSLVGSMGFHHMKRKMSQQLMGGFGGGQRGGGGGGFRAPRGTRRTGSSGSPPRAGGTPPSSDDEAPP
tara:strand:+ start:532 stop:1473 length:942 start_codon:yes stop_codon:yes gene_type:complete